MDFEKSQIKEKDGVLIFTPDNNKTETKILYPKDKYLCGDAACKKIYAKSKSVLFLNFPTSVFQRI